MTTSNLWADFVRWVSTIIVDKDKSSRIMHAAKHVSTREEARVAIFAAHSSVAMENIDVLEAQWLREYAAPADTRSVDVPPTGGREALLRLADKLDERASKEDRQVIDELDAGIVRGMRNAARMARAAAEEL